MHPRRALIEEARSIPTPTMSLTPRPVHGAPVYPYRYGALPLHHSSPCWSFSAGHSVLGLWFFKCQGASLLIPLLLGAGTLNCKVPPSRWDDPTPRLGSHQPRMLTNVIPELVRMLSQPETTSPGLLVLKTSSKSGLPIAWITGHATIPQPQRKRFNYISAEKNCVLTYVYITRTCT